MKELLIKALKAAGEIQKARFKSIIEIEQKESISSIVTEVDLLCDKIIKELIQTDFPEHNILTEESGLTNKNSNYTWVIDPLDGTSNFVAGIPWFGVLIALFDDNQPILAGAYLPIVDVLFWAEKGKGAYVNNEKLRIKPIELKNALAGFAIDFSDDSKFVEHGLSIYRTLLKYARNIRCTNSLVDLMMVAEGKLGITCNMQTKIWDIAAPYLIIKEAGGELDLLSDQELIFDLSENALGTNYSIVAGSASIVEELMTKLKEDDK